MRPWLALMGVVMTGTVLAGCGSASKSASPAATVQLQAVNFSFNPTAISLKAGQSVTLEVTNAAATKHNLTVPGLKVNKDLDPGNTAKVTLTPSAGTYPFHCEYHPTQMTGTITVS